MLLETRQQQMLARAAALLPPAQQESFRTSVHGVLDALLVRSPTDASLRDVLRNVLALRGVAVGAAALLPPPQQHGDRHDRSSNNFRNWARRKANPAITA
jgi:hypothetical protein